MSWERGKNQSLPSIVSIEDYHELCSKRQLNKLFAAGVNGRPSQLRSPSTLIVATLGI